MQGGPVAQSHTTWHSNQTPVNDSASLNDLISVMRWQAISRIRPNCVYLRNAQDSAPGWETRYFGRHSCTTPKPWPHLRRWAEIAHHHSMQFIQLRLFWKPFWLLGLRLADEAGTRHRISTWGSLSCSPLS
jgi:hypothetical protein